MGDYELRPDRHHLNTISTGEVYCETHDVFDDEEDGLVAHVAPLDAAWAEAEAAMPEGRHIDGVLEDRGVWRASAADPVRWETLEGFGRSPAAALRALAARLREMRG